MPQSNSHSNGNWRLNVILLAGAIGTFVILGCWGCFVGFFMTGLGMLSHEITEQVRNRPAIQDHIGDVQSHFISPDAAREARQRGADCDYALDLNGTRGHGILLVSVDRHERVHSATLQLPSGDEIVVMEE
jgi:hypothetical protein